MNTVKLSSTNRESVLFFSFASGVSRAVDLKINIRAVQLSIMCSANDVNKLILVSTEEKISMSGLSLGREGTKSSFCGKKLKTPRWISLPLARDILG